jgi:nitrate reductase alpha subunit
MNWIEEISNPQARQWEEFYRNRWQHDRVVRSTHGVNCTGSCSWMIYVKDGIVTWEIAGVGLSHLAAWSFRRMSRAVVSVGFRSRGISTAQSA